MPWPPLIRPLPHLPCFQTSNSLDRPAAFRWILWPQRCCQGWRRVVIGLAGTQLTAEDEEEIRRAKTAIAIAT